MQDFDSVQVVVLTNVGMGIKGLCKSTIFENVAIVRGSISLRCVWDARAWKSRSKKGLGPPQPRRHHRTAFKLLRQLEREPCPPGFSCL